LDRAHLFEREHRIAESLQRSLLPKTLPAGQGVKLAARYLPASAAVGVGGDWYDALELADGRLLLAVATSSDTASKRRKRWATCAAHCAPMRLRMPPGIVVVRLGLLVDHTQPHSLTTLALALVDPSARRLQVACAATHRRCCSPPAKHRGVRLEGRGLPLGAGPTARYQQVTRVLEPERPSCVHGWAGGTPRPSNRSRLARLAAAVGEGTSRGALRPHPRRPARRHRATRRRRADRLRLDLTTT